MSRGASFRGGKGLQELLQRDGPVVVEVALLEAFFGDLLVGHRGGEFGEGDLAVMVEVALLEAGDLGVGLGGLGFGFRRGLLAGLAFLDAVRVLAGLAAEGTTEGIGEAIRAAL